jgi:hypothetical protein
MLTKSKFIAAFAVAALVATPAFAQAFSRTYGTGNSMATYYSGDGTLHIGSAPQPGTALQQGNQIAAHRSGENAFASVPLYSAGSDNPASTGGGSTGYNENLRTDQW